jgi:hypothetical protein
MTASDYMTAVEVLLFAVWVEAVIRATPFSRVLERIRRPSAATTDPSAAARECQRLLRFVAVAYDILPFPGTCLRKSLVLHGLLARRGVSSRFCFGVAKDGPALAAHAWIECDGVANDSVAEGFSELRAMARFFRASPQPRV